MTTLQRSGREADPDDGSSTSGLAYRRRRDLHTARARSVSMFSAAYAPEGCRCARRRG